MLWERAPTPGSLRFAKALPTSHCVTPSLIRLCLKRSANASNSLGKTKLSLKHLKAYRFNHFSTIYLGSVSVSGSETWVAWWWGWWGWPKEEWGDIIEVTEEVWLYMLGWLSWPACAAACPSADMGRLDMGPLLSESPLCGLPNMSSPLMLGWSIWKGKAKCLSHWATTTIHVSRKINDV